MNPFKKILVTGASGFTGQHACKYFLQKGYEVHALYRTNPITVEGVCSYCCNLTNKKEIREIIKIVNPEMVLHLAGQNHVAKSWADPIDSMESNVLSTLHLLEAIRLEVPNCKNIIVGSSLEVNSASLSTPTHPYSLSKSLQSLIAQSWGSLFDLNIIIAKPSNLVGPGNSSGICAVIADKITDMEDKEAGILNLFNPKAQRDFLDVRDVVSAYEKVFLSGIPGEIYNIASGVSRTLEDICSIYQELSKRPFSVNSTIYEDEDEVKIDTSKLKALGWKPEIPLIQSLGDMLNFHQLIKGKGK